MHNINYIKKIYFIRNMLSQSNDLRKEIGSVWLKTTEEPLAADFGELCLSLGVYDHELSWNSVF